MAVSPLVCGCCYKVQKALRAKYQVNEFLSNPSKDVVSFHILITMELVYPFLLII